MGSEARLAVIGGVIAGTPVDTALGVNYLEHLGYRTLSFPAGRSPKEQSFLQQYHPNLLQQLCLRKAQDMAQAGAQFILIYCNSLSATLDLNALRTQLNIPLITPMDVYQTLAMQYQRFAIVAANAIGLLGADTAIMRHNPAAWTLGYQNIEIVRRIEQQKPPEAIIAGSGLREFINIAVIEHADLILLACTHYPCLTPSLQSLSAIPVIDIDMSLADVIDTTLRRPAGSMALVHDISH